MSAESSGKFSTPEQGLDYAQAIAAQVENTLTLAAKMTQALQRALLEIKEMQ